MTIGRFQFYFEIELNSDMEFGFMFVFCINFALANQINKIRK